MNDKSDQPESTGRRRFFRQFLASAIEGVEDLGRGLNEAKREIEAQRRSWYDSSHYEPSYRPAPTRYGPPWPPPAGPPIPDSVRPRLRELQQYYYPQDGTISREDPTSD